MARCNSRELTSSNACPLQVAAKLNGAPFLFIFVSDCAASAEPLPARVKNAVVVSKESMALFYGDWLARRRSSLVHPDE
jgi:hypothetical protein